MNNVWNEFFKKEKRLKSDSTYKDWKQAGGGLYSRNLSERQMAIRLLALAWYETKNTETPLGFGQKMTNVEDVARETFGVVYNRLGANIKRLESGLADLGFTLLRAPNGDYQYLRTIHLYSGVVFLKAAERAARLSPEQWVTGKQLHPDIQRYVEQYINKRKGENDGAELIADVRDFFARMEQRYRLYNAAPSLGLCAEEETDIPGRILNMIWKKLWPNTEDPPIQTPRDTLPVFRLNSEGVPAIGFQGTPAFVVDEETRTINFVFELRQGGFEVAQFKREGSSWSLTAGGKWKSGIPIENIQAIRRREFKNGICVKDRDVTPEALFKNTHLLFRLAGNGPSLQVIDTQTPVKAYESYIAVGLKSTVSPRIEAIGEDDAARELTPDRQGWFSVPQQAVMLRIDETEYRVKTAFDDLFTNMEERFENIQHPGTRLFFTQGTLKLNDNLLLDISLEAKRLQYKKDSGEIVLLPSATIHGLQVPETVLWNPGKLEIVDVETGQTSLSRAVTFLPPVDASQLDRVFALEEAGSVEVGLGDERVTVEIPGTRDQVRFDSHIRFDSHGLTFKYPIQRLGITVKIGDQDQVFVLQAGRPFALAKTDFEESQFSFVVAKEQRANTVLVVWQGNQQGPLRPLPKRPLRASDLKDKLDFRKVHYPAKWGLSLNVGSNVQRFEVTVYDPEDYSIACRLDPDSLDLEVTSEVALKTVHQTQAQTHSLGLIYFPAHRQDKPAQFVPCDPDTLEFYRAFNDLTPWEAELHFSRFGQRQDIDWGAGLYAFVAMQEGVENAKTYTAQSSVFFIARPEALGEWSGCTQDEDPYGLRTAMARRDMAEIERIIMDADEGGRAYIREFAGNVWHEWNEVNGLEKCPAYCIRSRCLDYPANGYYSSHPVESRALENGYFFMAGWLVREWFLRRRQLQIDHTFDPNHQGLWSPLLWSAPDENERREMKRWVQSYSVPQQREQSHGNPREGLPSWWVAVHTFYLLPGHRSSEMCQMMGIAERTKDICPESFVPQRDDPSFYCPSYQEDDFFQAEENPNTPEGWTGRLSTFTNLKLERCLSRLGKLVANWIRHPTCEGAQSLKEILLDVQDLDNTIQTVLNNSPHRPQFTMTDRIYLKAWAIMETESAQTNNL